MTVAVVSVLLTLCGLVPAAIARAKGYSFLLWWAYGTILIVVALPHAILAEPASRDARGTRARFRRCPCCEGRLSRDAVKCRQCGHTLDREPVPRNREFAPDFDSWDVGAGGEPATGPTPAWDDGFARLSSMGPATPDCARRTKPAMSGNSVVAAVAILSVGALVVVGAMSINALDLFSGHPAGHNDQQGPETLSTADRTPDAPSPPPSPPPWTPSAASPSPAAQGDPAPPSAPPVPSPPPAAITRDMPPPAPPIEERPTPSEVADIDAQENRPPASPDAVRSGPASDEMPSTSAVAPSAPVVREERNPVGKERPADSMADGEDRPSRDHDEKRAISAPEENKPAAATTRAKPATSGDDIQAVGEVVAWLQSGLREFGYYDGPINGRAGLQTQQAIRAYQRSRDMTPHGRIDHALIVSLRRSLNETSRQSKLRR